jgi:hypothetical protein
MLVDFAHVPSETPITRAPEFFNHLKTWKTTTAGRVPDICGWLMLDSRVVDVRIVYLYSVI